MTTKEFIARLKQLSDGNKEIIQQISKLSKLAPTEEQWQDQRTSRVELGEEIHESLKEIEGEFDLLKREAEIVTSPPVGQRRRDPEKEKDRILLITQIERFGEDIKLSRGQYRRAQLQAKRSEEEAQRKRARESLFALTEPEDGDTSTANRRRAGRDGNRTQDDIILSAAGDVTAGLRRTHQLMTQELERSRFAHETLQKSTAALNSLNESYTGLDDLLKSSRSLISTLVSSQKSDTWYLETAIKIAIATLVWLVFRRWFYGPILYLVYKPSRFMFGAIYSVFNLTLSVLTGTLFKLGGESQDVAVSSSSRAPLIIQPSATGGIPKRRPDQAAPSVKVGLGGSGEAEFRSPEERAKDEETLPERVAAMAEQAKRQERQHQGEIPIQERDPGAAGGNVAGDETVLRERGADEKPNPKKRMMEVPPAPPGEEKANEAKDEL